MGLVFENARHAAVGLKSSATEFVVPISAVHARRHMSGFNGVLYEAFFFLRRGSKQVNMYVNVAFRWCWKKWSYVD